MLRVKIAGVGLAMAVALGACMAPITPAQKLTEAAQELNLEARFGRMDMAVTRASPTAREAFLERRSEWGRDVRVVDVALVGMAFEEDQEAALVTVDIAWTRMDEGSLRSTRVAQVWRDRDGSWQLTRERRVAGDVGLFGEQVEIVRPTSKDVQFASKTIR